MRGLTKLTLVQMKLYLREPVAAFFTLFFAPLMLLLFGFIYGNDPVPIFGNRGMMDVSVPAYMALIIATVGLMAVPIGTASRRETGVLRRFRATPLRPTAYLISEVAVYFGMTLLGVLLLIAVGRAVYDVRFEGRLLDVIVGFALASASFLTTGYLIASLAPTARVAQVVGMIVFYPMIFLSGATIPLQVLPETVQNVARFIPLTYAVRLLQGLWFGDPWGDHLREVAALTGLLVVGGIAAARTFRWSAD
ncbi:MAG TPA: ABC transporter permease [Thermoflexia bacterium]|jgi:ABC-2 type transport system permease protein|nr:ABC transporter permease [Thermoflexia bacterium]